ncbi:MAG: MaoC family dehydratase [Chloroflexi bacterium]|nr:MaoC family dehydratase [Chloroflexota bacterium]MCH8351546.1 MaoC family dehydratase [Chloroflexota bacterium]MCI0781324.1 MaoC family dehydratase [Chloroflexota bacterium]MCI0785032.1 MaoC family dehydratase [Chloroflexota bacterium]MCI0793908.1 MaoC family dehydratase [Chloroflexota bacterium]
MGRLTRKYEIGEEVGPLVKEMTQEAINLFEGSSGESGPSQFTDEETAAQTLGTTGTVASGRMSLTFAIEMLRRYFGGDVFNRGGMVDLRFLRPVRPGDTITFTGKISEITAEVNGSRVSVDIQATNQNGDTTGVGKGSAVVPNAYLAQE